MSQLNTYIIALCNLYGLIHKDKLLEIYNSQNKKSITLKEVEDIMSKSSKELEDNFVYIYKDYFVHETIMAFDEFYLTLRKQGDKPYYIPNKLELLKYLDEFYIEPSKAYRNLFKFVKKNFFKNEPEQVLSMCEDIHGMLQVDARLDFIFPLFGERGLIFEDEAQVNEVLHLLVDLSNNIRLWENRGHTPKELSSMHDKTKLTTFSNKVLDTSKSYKNETSDGEIVGKNDRCPCGSGKKYKMCCMRKELFH